MTSIRIGSLGESTLKVWCDQIGVTANKAFDDQEGWDFLLEFPFQLSHSGNKNPIDRAAFPLRCLIQVKATFKNSCYWNVKLDNWLRLVKHPLPTFFLVLEFDHQHYCRRAYLVHIDNDYIKEVLKRLRAVPPEDIDRLHKMYMRFRYNEKHALFSPTGMALGQKIRSYISDDPEQYTKEKIEFMRTTGYEQSGWYVNLTLPNQYEIANVKDVLVDFSLGLIPQLHVSAVEVRDIRFGIVAPYAETLSPEGGLVYLESPPTGKSVLRFKSNQSSRDIRIEADVFVPQGLAFELEPRHRKVRLAGPFVDFIIWPGINYEMQMLFKVESFQEPQQLKKLRQFADFLLLIDEAARNNDEVKFEKFYEQAIFGNGRIVPKNLNIEPLHRFLKAVQKAWDIIKYFDLSQNVTMSMGDIMRQESQLDFMYAVLCSRFVSIRAVFWVEGEKDDEKLCCIPLVGQLKIGDYQLVVAVAAIGQVEKTGNVSDNSMEYCFLTQEVNIIKERSDENITFNDVDIHKFKQLVIEKYTDSMHIISLDNY